ncbi:MAG: shikimate kinase [Candidatus Eremiobacteraeota bacterium]|nr:shikimate kinase [Candidatus Eremiobacteraeota bacterium]MBV9057324.1 shikimate kinase [Candidatus Eremiobacteraeota bacterium]MBV9700601.1 shikimate kinase [Candidatus Eremiobacteraeota bacterium]
MKRHVALTGFMAAGKSTLGRKLARELGCPFFDTDDLIARAHGAIATIFSTEGETAFRGYEAATVADRLGQPAASVIALGGGALTVAQTRTLLHERAYTIFIHVSPERALARVRASRQRRPMLGDRPTLATVKRLYEERLPHYARADYVVERDRRRDEAVIADVVAWLRERRFPGSR